MKVLIDARKIADTGIGVYTDSLIKSLLLVRESGEPMELMLLGNKDHLNSRSWSNQVRVINDTTRPYSLKEHFSLGKTINSINVDLFHVPHYTLPRALRVPAIATVHDVIHITHPEKFYYPAAASFLISHAMKRARKIIAVSESTASRLRDLKKNCKRGDIEVIPNAIDPSFLGSRVTDPEDLRSMGIRGEYLFSLVSMDKPHKNLAALIEAFKRLKSQDLPAFKNMELVLAGTGTTSFGKRDELAGHGIRVLGRVSFSSLKTLYAGAVCVVIPSLAEGFCLPVLEARALGTPVVVTPDPAIMELAGGQDVVCTGFSPEHIADGISHFFKARRREADKRSDSRQLEWLRKYTREEIGKRIFGIYKEVLAG